MEKETGKILLELLKAFHRSLYHLAGLIKVIEKGLEKEKKGEEI